VTRPAEPTRGSEANSERPLSDLISCSICSLYVRMMADSRDNCPQPSAPNTRGNRGAPAVQNAMAWDPRAIANLMLDEAERSGFPLKNLALQKLLYFAHALFLVERKRPLVSGYFEAWTYGPVHPTAYQAFKVAGADDINFRAERVNPATGECSEVPVPDDRDIRRHVARIMQTWGRLSTGRLVDISHARGAPWDYIQHKGRTSLAFGLRIPDEVIRERFKYHKVSVGHSPAIGEPSEDSPLA
jgi:uncharacterized phage-associated protein